MASQELVEFKQKQKYCCDPFQNHKKRQHKTLRVVTSRQVAMFPSKLKAGSKLCDICRKKIGLGLQPERYEEASAATCNTGSDSQESSALSSQECSALSQYVSDKEDNNLQCQEGEISVLNESLKLLGESPLVKRKLRLSSYIPEKKKKLKRLVNRKLNLVSAYSNAVANDTSEDDDHDKREKKLSTKFAENIIKVLKDKYKSTQSNSEKIRILTMFVSEWSTRKIMREFNCSHRLVSQAKNILETKGVLLTPNPRKGKSLPVEVKDIVKDFYYSDTISRAMPGKKDFLSVMVNQEKKHVQKRLVLSNLKEVFQLFTEKYPNTRIGFSKFAELRPKECVLAGSSGTHCVCVCTIHQNVKLMIVGSHMDDLQLEEETETPIKNYKHALATIQCNPFLPACPMGECKNCPGVATLKEWLFQCFENKGIEEIEYKQWTTTDRLQLQTFVQSTDEFIERFLKSLKTLAMHDFIAQEQAKYLEWKKSNLADGEFLVIGDFSENYSFIIQDAAQGFHWTNNQATLHPFVFYFKTDGELRHGSYVLLLECNTHDTIAVHLFQRKLIMFLKEKYEVLKITYFTDGCAAQYKNCKNFINLCYHEEYFGMTAEWHFFATSHGKGPCDGVGGTVKREAARASLQRPYNDQIMTTYQLYMFAKENIHGISFEYLTANDWQIESTTLKERLSNARTIPGTHKLHCFKPLSTNELQVQYYSASSEYRIEKITSQNIIHR
ncbi:unnamed protein product, partial [Rotaria magnacalcarata]